ncbi:flagellar hook-length control protein [Streptomyces corynorhini]|uniref:Flagellar hook-length control protein n=1 Tax=Streptomyces corynorhini TaxID=2282652 RepID=A0A370BET0_9ACTN|nr:flagellar hook-length control protein [Streptomyces corynorhini]RDG38754.1 flagellar hook-length control protein [Streptomyces corynorhini]
MKKILARGAAALAAASLTLLSPIASAQAAVTADHAGMTWTVAGKGSDGTVHVGSDSVTDAYNGDTPATASLPVLCLRITNAPVPAGITPTFYIGWARGTVAATPPVQGTALTSRAVADALCAQYYGEGWRTAEFHDGRYGANLEGSGGWAFWAHGYLPENTRFWTAINDTNANPWS